MKKFRVILLTLILIAFAVATIIIGGSKSEPGSFKILEISASPESEAKYKRPNLGEPVEMAYQFLELNKEFIPVRSARNELAVRRVELDKTGAMVSFKQLYNGIELLHSDIRAFFYSDGNLKSVEGNYIYDINLSTDYSFDSLSAVQMALKDVESAPAPKVECPSKPIIAHSSEFDRRDENRVYLVWPVQVFYNTTGITSKGNTVLYGYYIDALNGSILKKGEYSTLTDRWKSPHPPVPVPK